MRTIAAPVDRLRLDRLRTPIGEALLVTDAEGHLRLLDWSEFEDRLQTLLRRQYGAIKLMPGRAPANMRRALDDYFAGDLGRLRDIPWRTGGTPFQRKVWKALCAIPAGKTLSYGALAAKLDVPRAMRAVGLANGANPVSIVVPCHRVIGSDGSLTGYGGGLHRKRWLLTHEGAVFRDTFSGSAGLRPAPGPARTPALPGAQNRTRPQSPTGSKPSAR